ncbi:hypothetical protein BVRB_7g180550 [Beta vulgaris subsp. vulgaris]|uniref:Uncharacterized protein n=1 Tax=Beta vulgaris subsp. vulgaris TaxID=3555 RepID=A0A0J8BAA7_BETVV|nr:hypothetical protein BVRB_7g180550 [Beta vulgaris subsp. vulgaris]
MQGQEALRTVECLRGRLQAERAASRAAEQNAELLAKQLEDLEKQLKIERKSTRKAEKKLNFLKKKLELLKIPFSINISEECERSISSNNSESSCLSSIASASFDHQDLLPEFQTSKSSSTTSDMAEEAQSEISVQNKSHDINKCDGSQINSSAGQQESDQLCHGSQRQALDKRMNKHENEENQDDHHVDNSLALVPVTSIIDFNNSSNGMMKLKSENVREVLDTLRHIRSNLQKLIGGEAHH